MDILDPTALSRIEVVSYGVTDVGLERKNNEDAFHIEEASGLYVVCDGMGGHASGELASRLTVEAIANFVTNTMLEPGFRWPYNTPGATTLETRILDSAVRLANRAVYDAAIAEPRHKGMGTTIVALMVGQQQIGVVHVGDSRVYRLRNGDLTQLTDDHSLLNHYIKTRGLTDEQIRTFKGKNVIVRAIGLRDTVQPDVQIVDAQGGDVLLLCSDGLTDLVSDELIKEQMLVGRTDLKAGVDQLIRAALARGGRDNITIVMVRTAGDLTAGPIASGSPTTLEDTSPGFDIVGGEGAWDQETLPSYESALVAPPARPSAPAMPQPRSGQQLDGDTPEAMPAVPHSGAIQLAASVTVQAARPMKFAPGSDSKGAPIPPPPPPANAGFARPEAPIALPASPLALPGRPAVPSEANLPHGRDSRGAPIPPPPGPSGPKLGAQGAINGAARTAIPAPPADSGPPLAARSAETDRGVAATDAAGSRPVSPTARAQVNRSTRAPESELPFATPARPASSNGEPPPLPPQTPEASAPGMPAGDVGPQSVEVGPAVAPVTPTGMATAPYLSVVRPPPMKRPVAPVIVTSTSGGPLGPMNAAELFTAPTGDLPVSVAQAIDANPPRRTPATPPASAADIFTAPTAVLPTQSANGPTAAPPEPTAAATTGAPAADETPPRLPTDPPDE